jgi:hypothetical protein
MDGTATTEYRPASKTEARNAVQKQLSEALSLAKKHGLDIVFKASMIEVVEAKPQDESGNDALVEVLKEVASHLQDINLSLQDVHEALKYLR